MTRYFRSSIFSPALAGLFFLLAIAAPASSQDFSPEAISKANPYKDLPGVKDPQQAKPDGDEAKCSREVELRSFRRRDGLSADQTGMVYRCEKNGITVESVRPPRSEVWNPLDEK